MESSVQSLAAWGRRAPSHSITGIMITDDQQTIVTGSQEGQLCLWSLSSDLKISPRALLFGHTASITCVAKARDFEKKPYVVSAASNGEMSLWNVRSGQCVENTKMTFTHTSICYYYSSFRMEEDGWLLCIGEYQDVLVIDARVLEVLHTFISSESPDWISSMCIVHSPRIQEDSLVVVSVTGVLKVWNLSSSVKSVQEKQLIFETESKSLQCLMCQTIRFCKYTERLLLVVCSDSWKVYDYCDFSLLCMELSKTGQGFTGGELLPANRLLVWTEDGHSYIYQLSDRGLLKHVIYPPCESSASETVSPRMLCCTSDRKISHPVLGFISERKEPFYKILFSGDESGRITLWHIPDVPIVNSDGSPKEIQVAVTCSLADSFKQHVSEEIVGPLSCPGDESPAITVSVYIPNNDQLVCGCEDGKIIVMAALRVARAKLLEDRSQLRDWLSHKTVQGHSGRVTCLLYPYNKSVSFNPSWLVSGGQDSCVVWWDVFTGEILHKFTLQAGPVVNLSVPPEECRPKVHQSVCCLASDQSIALLNLQEQACIIHARKHLFSVKIIKWRPVEDFLVVGCEDGSVYVWEIESGALERHETGDTAKAILSSCDDSQAVLIDRWVPIPAGARPNHLYQRNHLHCKATSSFKHNRTQEKVPIPELILSPFTVFQLKATSVDNGFHVLTFDVEGLLEQLHPSPEERSDLLSSYDSSEALRRVASFDRKQSRLKRNKTSVSLHQVNEFVRERLFQSENNIYSAADEGVGMLRRKKKNSRRSQKQDLGKLDINRTEDTARLLLSCLFPWGTDGELDDLCTNNLGIFTPQAPVSFGLQSKNGHMSLILPGWHPQKMSGTSENGPYNLISNKVMQLAKQYTNSSAAETSFLEKAEDKKEGDFGLEITSYLLSIVLVVSSLMRLPLQTDESIEHDRHEENGSHLYKRRAKDAARYPLRETESLKKLITSWQQQSVEVLEAVQAVLLVEVQRIIKTLRKTSISSQAVTVAENRNGETQTLPKIGGTELLESQQSTAPLSTIEESSILQLSEKAPHSEAPAETVDVPKCVEHTGNPPDPHQNITATCIQQQCLKQRARKSNITGGLKEVQFDCCKLC
ncbi:WD repeat-containing protein 72-like isoform X2 [Huso huso]|uniref:WD repeat-containing protein 72-like isoform X2 n=1 Tax=Huso huso TaxID=61971 RepID=A0ABR0YRF9_HUSHU